MFVGTGKLRKPHEYREARRLRAEQGMPFKRIAAKLGVSPGTVHAWTRDIELSPAQQWRNVRGPRGPANPEVVARRAATWAGTNRDRRREYQSEGRARAKGHDPLHMAGCMLYWAEGSKHRNRLTFCNSDMGMVRFTRRFLTECFGVRPEEFTLRLNVYTNNGLTVDDIEDHWLRALDLPRSCLRGHSLNSMPTSSSGAKRNKLPYGVASLSVLRSTHIIQHIFGAIQEYGGFDEPTWLDGPKRPPRPRGPLRERAHKLRSQSS